MADDNGKEAVSLGWAVDDGKAVSLGVADDDDGIVDMKHIVGSSQRMLNVVLGLHVHGGEFFRAEINNYS